jgi:hypothetical protein
MPEALPEALPNPEGGVPEALPSEGDRVPEALPEAVPDT